ncbi:MAG: hypothetical protein CMF46_05425 [Legionellales bacterium]|nr:hypothetical protein [Legionellales bacterium]|tara:strand:- start:484 stop:1263 length:780 start_codon:yes stop_codon:yes gene_type:complete
MSETHIIAVTNQKGGVGKTTSALNICASLGALKQPTLLIDFDPQGNASHGCDLPEAVRENSSYELIMQETPADELIQQTSDLFDIITTKQMLTAAEIQLAQKAKREFSLKTALNSLTTPYRYIIIDCPPSLNLLTVNALVAASSVIIPVQCEYYALEGLTRLMRTIQQLKNTVNPSLEIEGILRTMYDSRNRLSQDVSDQLTHYFGELLYNTIIPRNVKLAEAPSHRKVALSYDPDSSGAISYLTLASEILRKKETIYE